MKKTLLLISSLVLFYSCNSVNLSEANKRFEDETDTRLVDTLQELYSLSPSYDNDPAYTQMINLIETGAVTLVSIEDCEYRAVVEKDVVGYKIMINNIFHIYEGPTNKLAYLTALLATAAKMEIVTGEIQDYNIMHERFFEIIEMYKQTNPSVNFDSDEWFADHNLDLYENYIY